MGTPHNDAAPGDIAPVVLMPGDPKRADRIAATILDGARVVTDVRGIRAYTGTYAGDGTHHGRPLTVMASGMGMPSMGIYATELFRFYDVQRIVRLGTAGGIAARVDVGDAIVVTGAHTTSSMNELRIPGTHFAAVADFRLARAAMDAVPPGARVHVGTVVTTDHFYFPVPGQLDGLRAHGVLAVEMETAGLYGVAAEFSRSALAVVTVSDHLTKPGTDMTAAERETSYGTGLALALAAAFAEA